MSCYVLNAMSANRFKKIICSRQTTIRYVSYLMIFVLKSFSADKLFLSSFSIIKASK